MDEHRSITCRKCIGGQSKTKKPSNNAHIFLYMLRLFEGFFVLDCRTTALSFEFKTLLFSYSFLSRLFFLFFFLFFCSLAFAQENYVSPTDQYQSDFESAYDAAVKNRLAESEKDQAASQKNRTEKQQAMHLGQTPPPPAQSGNAWENKSNPWANKPNPWEGGTSAPSAQPPQSGASQLIPQGTGPTSPAFQSGAGAQQNIYAPSGTSTGTTNLYQ